MAEDHCLPAPFLEHKILFVTHRHSDLCSFAIYHHLPGDNMGTKNIFYIWYDVEKFDKHCPRETNTYEQGDTHKDTQRYIFVYNGKNVK